MITLDNETTDTILARSQTSGRYGLPDTLVEANVHVLCILLYVFWLLLNKYIMYYHFPTAGEQAVLARAMDDRALATARSDDSRLAPRAQSPAIVEKPDITTR